MNRNNEWEGSFMLLDYAVATVIVSAKYDSRIVLYYVFFCGDNQLVSVLLEE